MIKLSFGEKVSLKDIEESGQCFRWAQDGEGRYRVTASGKVADVRQSGEDAIEVDAPEDQRQFWENYFDIGTSYSEIRRRIPESDAYMQKAAREGEGLRIIRQDPWETLVTFIISQRKNIPAIKLCVRKLCRVAGKKIVSKEGTVYHLFPAPDEILSLKCNKTLGLPEKGGCPCSFQAAGFENCSLGYRMPYLFSAAAWWKGQDPDALRALDDESLQNALMEIKGVGVKVASCVMLFGFHRTNAFPVDVWMERALKAHYPEGFDFQSYAPYAGILQQYMFCEARKSGK